MNNLLSNNVFVDTNVLINDFFYREKDKVSGKYANLAIRFLKQFPKVKIYIASFSVVQLISTLDKAKIDKEAIAKEIQRILSRFEIIDLTAKDLNDSLSVDYKDTEDAIQYTLCRKLRCQHIITDNVKDFQTFGLVTIVKPKKIRKIALVFQQ